MLVPIVRFIFVFAGTIVGGLISRTDQISKITPFYLGIITVIALVLVGAGIGYVLGGVIGRRLSTLVDWVENVLIKIPASEIILGAAGLIVGFVVAYLISPTLEKIGLVGVILSVFSFVILGLLGVYLSIRKKKDLEKMIQNLGSKESGEATPKEVLSSDKIIDTSTIIDGRIADVAQIGFIEGHRKVPVFVLKELQNIADSRDDMKRVRGRRGLDILNKLQKESLVEVNVLEKDYEDTKDVDEKLVRLAKELGDVLVTNDYNLNKVARLQGVKVLNINDLANAVKPVVIPGEEMFVKVMKEGKEPQQGVGYLDDGTMIVIEEGRKSIGKEVQVKVTSVLQTSAGKMIFTRLKERKPK